MNEKTFGSRLKIVLKARAMTQQDLVTAMKSNKGTVSKWTNDKVQPEVNTVKRICRATGASYAYLNDGQKPMFSDDDVTISAGAYDELKHKPAPDSGKITTPSDIPVVGKVPAGSPNTNDWDVEYHIQVPGMPSHCYAMLVTGDSMEPRIMEGEHVIFTLDYTLESDNVVIVTDEYGDSMVKRYKEKDGKQYLVSDNSKYAPVEPNHGYSIVGKVINSVLIKKH